MSDEVIVGNPLPPSLPEWSYELGVLRIEWGPPELVRIEIERMRPDRSGDLVGEITVSSLTTPLPARLHASRLNLTSTRSRAELARYLRERNAAHSLDWQTIVEQSAVHAVDAYRRGEPAVLLRDLPRPVAERHLFPHILADDLTIHFGDGGDLKSYSALAAGAAIASGRADILGMAPAETRPVGYLDWESSGRDHRERLERLCGAAMPGIVYVRCEAPLVAELDRVKRIVREHALGFLVLDSIAYACDGPPEAAEVAANFIRALRQLEIGVLAIAHVNRSGDESRPFGSAF